MKAIVVGVYFNAGIRRPMPVMVWYAHADNVRLPNCFFSELFNQLCEIIESVLTCERFNLDGIHWSSKAATDDSIRKANPVICCVDKELP